VKSWQGGASRGSNSLSSPRSACRHLEKALGGRRPFTLATTVRLEEALGVSLRKRNGCAGSVLPSGGDVAPDHLGAYSRRAVAWIEGTYVTLRPSFGDKEAIYAYRTEIAWDAKSACLLFREGERLDADFTQFGEVAVPNQSGHVYLVTTGAGKHRLVTVSRPNHHRRDVRHPDDASRRKGSLLTPDRAPNRICAGSRRGERKLRRVIRMPYISPVMVWTRTR